MRRLGVAARALARRATAGAAVATLLVAATPANLVVENVPDFPTQLVDRVHPYLDYRTAPLTVDWVRSVVFEFIPLPVERSRKPQT